MIRGSAVLGVLVWLMALAAPADARRPPLRIDTELESYFPTKQARTIQTVFANSVVGLELLRGHLLLESGITATAAWGHIRQSDVRLDTAVFGIGPLFMIRCVPFEIDGFSLLLDIVGGLVIYSSHFPPGGDVYNFTWRLGGMIAVRLTARLSVTGGVRWMHVSNGQGLTPKNPSYEGVGFPVGLVYRF